MRSRSKRAHFIVVTKCKPDLAIEEKEEIIRELHTLPHQKVFFTTIEYDSPYHLFTGETRLLETGSNILLVCGIANPGPLKQLLVSFSDSYEIIQFTDHHIFNTEDLKEIKKRFSKMTVQNKIIITTEKDGVRLAKYKSELKDLPVYVIPMRHQFLFEEENQFEADVISFVETYHND
mgnify:CR=1 FL=1